MSVGTVDLVVYKAAGGTSDNGAKSGTSLASGVQNGLWPDISDALRTSGGTRIKKWFIANEHATDALSKPTVWNGITPTGLVEDLGLGFDSVDDSDNAQGNMTAWGANAVVSLTSSGADTRTATIYGVNNAGLPATEAVVLTGAVEKLSTTTWSKVWGIVLSALNANTVTIKQGAAGTTRGTIGNNKKACWLWVTAVSQAAGIYLPNLVAGSSYGFWDRQTWAPATASSRPTMQRVSLVETN